MNGMYNFFNVGPNQSPFIYCDLFTEHINNLIYAYPVIRVAHSLG